MRFAPHTVYLAMRTTAPTGATRLQRLFAWLTHWRLASEYVHGGVVVTDGNGFGSLIQANLAHGVHLLPRGEWTPKNWVFKKTRRKVAHVMAIFAKVNGKAYDVLGLFGFVGVHDDDPDKYYCFQLCAKLLGLKVRGLETPGTLFEGLLDVKE
jgi:hypothetical protein